jgi:IS1 family transposase
VPIARVGRDNNKAAIGVIHRSFRQNVFIAIPRLETPSKDISIPDAAKYHSRVSGSFQRLIQVIDRFNQEWFSRHDHDRVRQFGVAVFRRRWHLTFAQNIYSVPPRTDNSSGGGTPVDGLGAKFVARWSGFIHLHKSALAVFHCFGAIVSRLNRVSHAYTLATYRPECSEQKPRLCNPDSNQEQIETPISPVSPVSLVSRYRHGGKFGDSYGLFCIFMALFGAIPLGGLGLHLAVDAHRWWGWCLASIALALDVLGCASGAIGCLPWDWGRCLHDGQQHSQRDIFHSGIIVTQKDLTTNYYCNTVIGMANVLNTDKQVAIISALAEGSSIRSIERITGVHRDTIMRLGVRVGKGCEMLLDSKMQDLGCHYLQFDEVWGFIGKKERHIRIGDDPEMGDVWTYCAIDSETKLVPTFRVGKRTLATSTAFVQDVASRMRNRVQISTDALHGYVEAVERSFGADVDYGQIVKVYTHDAAQHPERKYSAPSFASAIRRPITGNPEMELVSTSHIERLNATTRLHVKRLSRLTLAFSKKLENFQAAVALHFAYYNFVKRHNSIRCTPAMAAGIERDFWTVAQLVEATV